jgi:hypothetical protein
MLGRQEPSMVKRKRHGAVNHAPLVIFTNFSTCHFLVMNIVLYFQLSSVSFYFLKGLVLYTVDADLGK